MTREQKVALIEAHFKHPINPSEMTEKELDAWVQFIGFLNQ